MRALSLTLEAIASISGNEAKVQCAAAYLATQPRNRVATAARFLAGSPLPPGTPATKVGRSTLVDVVAAFAGSERADLLRLATRRGDLGVAVAELLESGTIPEPPALRLDEVAEELLRLGETGPSDRTRRLRRLLARASPLEAKYLVKLLLGSLRTGMQSSRVEEAIALAFDREGAAVRRAHMLLGDIGETASRAADASLHRVGLEPFRPVRLMLAYAVEGPDEVTDVLPLPCIAEDKYDGIRAQLHAAGGEVRLFSRALEDCSHVFPELRMFPAGLDDDWILDGEVVAWLDGRPLSFGMLQSRLGRRQVPLTLLLDAPVIFLAFDALRAGGRDLIDAPLSQRREHLKLLPDDGPVRRVVWGEMSEPADVTRWFEAALDRGSEGAVFKSPASAYAPGRRGRAWVKVKRAAHSLDVVVTGAEYGHGKRAGLLSDVVFAVRGPDGFLDIGKAFSGLTDPEIRELTRHLKETTLTTDGPVRRVEPTIVLEVAFDSVRASQRHPGGYALRFPRILRRRYDLRPDEISSIGELEQLSRDRPA